VSGLLWAAGRGHHEIVQLLVDNNVKVDIGDKYGTTALIWACRLKLEIEIFACICTFTRIQYAICSHARLIIVIYMTILVFWESVNQFYESDVINHNQDKILSLYNIFCL
jgi:hypothetical protein